MTQQMAGHWAPAMAASVTGHIDGTSSVGVTAKEGDTLAA